MSAAQNFGPGATGHAWSKQLGTMAKGAEYAKDKAPKTPTADKPGHGTGRTA